MVENNDTPIQSVQTDATIQSIQMPDGLIRKGYQPQMTSPHGPAPQSVSAIIPVASTPPADSGGAAPVVPVQPQDNIVAAPAVPPQSQSG